jgi:hypothetical protein
VTSGRITKSRASKKAKPIDWDNVKRLKITYKNRRRDERRAWKNVKRIKLTYKNRSRDEKADAAFWENVKLKVTYKNYETDAALALLEATKEALADEFHALVQAQSNDWTNEAAAAATQVAMRGDAAFNQDRPRNGLVCEADEYRCNVVADAIYTSTKAALRGKGEPRRLCRGRQVPQLDVSMVEAYDGGGYEEDVEPAEDPEEEPDYQAIWEQRMDEGQAKKAA